MQDKPVGAALLEVAAQALAREVAPHLEGKPRYVALMVANAIGIVAREIEGQAELAQAWQRALAGAEDGPIEDSAGRLAAAIRAGRHDADDALHQALLGTASVAAAIWKPERRGG